MADNRLKAVADGDGELNEIEERPGELELGLSLGRRSQRAGSFSGGGGKIRDWLSPFDLSVGNSRLLEDFSPRSSSEKRSWVGFEPGVEELSSEATVFKRNTLIQCKRPKVLAFPEPRNYISTPVASGASSAPMSQDFIGMQASFFPSESSNRGGNRDQNDGSGGQSMNSNDGGGEDGDKPTSSTLEDTEIRMDLTEDLLHLVFSFLSQKDLCKAGATCKQWQIASMHEEFWRCLNFVDTEISLHNFEAICHRYRNACEVNLSGISCDALAIGAMACLRRLETLTLGKVQQLGDDFFHALTDCPELNSLSISDGSLGNGIQEITIFHDRLRELNIVKCRVIRVSVRCPQLQTLSLRRTSMAHAVLNCPQLHELDLSSCHKLSDAGIRLATTACPLLASLDLSSCSCVSDETLREIAFACPNLCILDASYCPNISLESVRLPMLIDLKLHSCEGVTSGSMSALAYSRMLEALQLDNCGLLTSVSLDLPHLRSISLVHCRKLVDLNLRSPVLSYIKVSNCSALARINVISHALQKLVLQKQESLTTLSLQCHNLQEVDLSDCESLTNAICEVFSDGGGCPMLRSLVLDNCEVWWFF